MIDKADYELINRFDSNNAADREKLLSSIEKLDVISDSKHTITLNQYIYFSLLKL